MEWMSLSFTYGDEQDPTPPVDPSLVLWFALIASAATVCLAAGIALTWRERRWQHGRRVMFWAIAALCTSLLSAIGFWRLVSESVT